MLEILLPHAPPKDQVAFEDRAAILNAGNLPVTCWRCVPGELLVQRLPTHDEGESKTSADHGDYTQEFS